MGVHRIEKGLGQILANKLPDELGELALAIGHQVRSFRSQKNMTAVDCAKQANLSQAMLSKIENWKDAPLWDVDSINKATKTWFRFMEK